MRKSVQWLLLILTAVWLLAFGFYVFQAERSRDAAAPIISFQEDTLSLSVYAPQDELLQGVTALDDRDGDVTDSLVVEEISAIRSDHSATVTYAAFDRAGNVAKAKRTIQYTDYEGPKFSLSAPLLFRSGPTVDLFQYVSASDPLDGDLSDRVKANLVSGEADLSSVGVHEVELRVTNSMGDTARITVPVEVYSASDYNAAVSLSSYLVYTEAGKFFSPRKYLESLSAGSREYRINLLPSSEVTVDINSNVQTDTPGVYDVTYTVSYKTYTGYTRLIVVVEE